MKIGTLYGIGVGPGDPELITLKGVRLLDSSGLGSIVGLYVSARTRGCVLQVANASEQIRQLFSMTNLLCLFEAAGRHHRKTI